MPPEGDQSPSSGSRPRRVLLLGSTGSIGTQTVEVVTHLNALAASRGESKPFEIVGLAAGRNARLAFEQAQTLGVRDVAVMNGDGAVVAPKGVRLRTGPDAAESLVREVEADVVLAAIVGAAGLPATLAAVQRGMDVALANKETLVAAGAIVAPAARASGSRLLPVDSEHSAIWQCLGPALAPPLALSEEVRRIVLTASGGPFREWPLERIRRATVAEALNHPTWKMGAKVTIDSASLTNKALELIEAHWLFGVGADRLGAVVHPQSFIHSFVEFADGSTLAQAGPPDMRTPIQYAITWPARPDGCSRRVDWSALSRLDFEPVDEERFPAVSLGMGIIEGGVRAGSAGAVFNAANECAVEAFLAGRVPFGRISELVREAMEGVGAGPVRTLADVMDADAAAREFVSSRLPAQGGVAAAR